MTTGTSLPAHRKLRREPPLILSVCLRWRGGPSRQSSQRHANNANRDRGTGGQGDGRGGNAAWGGAGPAQEQHVPVRGFNASEAKNTLKKGTITLHDAPVLGNEANQCVYIAPGRKHLRSMSDPRSSRRMLIHSRYRTKSSILQADWQGREQPTIRWSMGLKGYDSYGHWLDQETNKRSKHHGQRKRLLRRASETDRLTATDRTPRRRLI